MEMKELKARNYLNKIQSDYKEFLETNSEAPKRTFTEALKKTKEREAEALKSNLSEEDKMYYCKLWKEARNINNKKTLFNENKDNEHYKNLIQEQIISEHKEGNTEFITIDKTLNNEVLE